MSLYKIALNSGDEEVADLMKKCRDVRDKIARVGRSLPTRQIDISISDSGEHFNTDESFDLCIIVDDEEMDKNEQAGKM